MSVKKLPIGHSAPYLGNEIICIPNPSNMQFTHITNLHIYPLNLNEIKKKKSKPCFVQKLLKILYEITFMFCV